jgi:hypothetical protein|nr:MAG TPA: hypothetical protein [Caudoviricetes sp.]
MDTKLAQELKTATEKFEKALKVLNDGIFVLELTGDKIFDQVKLLETARDNVADGLRSINAATEKITKAGLSA